MQLLNVAFGGSLLQHLPEATATRTTAACRAALTAPTTRSASVRVARRPRRRRAVPHTKPHHHQGVVIGEALVVSGVSVLDDLPEALERPDRGDALGVQCPSEADPHSRVIASLVQAASEYRARRELGAAV